MDKKAKKVQVFPLHDACEIGDINKIKSLLKKRHDINGYDGKHWTPLHCAANTRQLSLCKFLLQKGANPTLVTTNNATALHYLARMNENSSEFTSLLKLFIEKGSDVNHLNYQRNSPLSEACSRGALVAASFLIENGAKIDEINQFGETCLHTAIRGGKIEVVELLIKKGGRLDIVGKEGTPIELAERFFDPISLDKFRSLIGRSNINPPSSPARTSYNFNSLPIEVQQMAIESEIKPQMVDQNFDYFVSAVRIIMGDSFLPPKSDSAPAILQTDPTLNYKLIEESGAGSFGSVFFARSLKIKKKVAIKKIKATNIKEMKTNIKEISLLYKSQCKNVVTYIESYFLSSLQEHWIITEFMEGGSLHQAIKASPREAEIAYIVKNVLEGLAFMHSKCVVHRDVKSKNIMLDVCGDVKLVDFGLAIDLTRSSKISFSGTPFWMAPEIIRKEPQGYPVDIWALGITILEMANGNPPNHDNKLRAMWTIATEEGRIEFDDATLWSKEMSHFVSECLKQDPLDRPSSSLLLKHKWLHSSCTRTTFKSFITRAFMNNDLDLLGLT